MSRTCDTSASGSWAVRGINMGSPINPVTDRPSMWPLRPKPTAEELLARRTRAREGQPTEKPKPLKDPRY